MRSHALLVLFSMVAVNAQFPPCLGPIASFGSPSCCTPFPYAVVQIRLTALLQQCGCIGGPNFVCGPVSLGGVLGCGAPGLLGGPGRECGLDVIGIGGGFGGCSGGGIHDLCTAPLPCGAIAQEGNNGVLGLCQTGGCNLFSGVSEPVQGPGGCSACELGTYGPGLNSLIGINPAGCDGMVPTCACGGGSQLVHCDFTGFETTDGQCFPCGTLPTACPYWGPGTCPLRDNCIINAGLIPCNCGIPFNDPSLDCCYHDDQFQEPGYSCQSSDGQKPNQEPASSESNSGNGEGPATGSYKHEQNCKSPCCCSISKSHDGHDKEAS